MINRSAPLSVLFGINAQVQCDCGHLEFEVGITADSAGGNNFIRVLECIKCRKQMPVVHRSDTDLTPHVAERALGMRNKP